jgi:Uncharacterized membrane protein (homolog of Drosophila rhomboid)
MFGGRFTMFGGTPPVVKNLIYLNIIVFLATFVLKSQFQIDLYDILGAHYYQSSLFKPHQFVTYMFMHSINDFSHIFFNMFGLWMFGRILESVWGSKRFFLYYFVTGIGALVVNMLVQSIEFSHMASIIQNYTAHPSWDSFNTLIDKYVQYPSDYLKDFMTKFQYNPTNTDYLNESKFILAKVYTEYINIPVVGASGAIFGVLLAFGMLFPNTELMLLFPPIPIKAKWFVLGYGAIELYSGLSQPGSNVAHFAHLGGMLFGFILVKYWNKKRTNFY